MACEPEQKYFLHFFWLSTVSLVIEGWEGRFERFWTEYIGIFMTSSAVIGD